MGTQGDRDFRAGVRDYRVACDRSKRPVNRVDTVEGHGWSSVEPPFPDPKKTVWEVSGLLPSPVNCV